MKQDLRVTVTKRLIQESLIRLLESKAIDQIRVKELCTEAGINRATFYRHYETVCDVLREIEMDVIRAMPQPRQKPKSITEAKAYLETLCAYLYDRTDIMKILVQNRTDEEMLQSITDFYRDYLDVYLHTLPMDRPDADTVQIALALLGGGSHCLMKQCVMGQIRKTPEELAEILCNIIPFQDTFPLFFGS